jgi:Fur family ferric uptake transcriptional regulator
MLSAPIVRRNTLQRKVILEELRHMHSHPTAAELHRIVRKRLPRISLGTVYRNLELLGQMGLVRRLELGGGQTRFDGDPSQHDHVRCIRCDRVSDVRQPPGLRIEPAFGTLSGYHVIGHRLEYYGICPDCQQREERSEDGS